MEFEEFYAIVKRVALGLMRREGHDHSWTPSDAAHEVILKADFASQRATDIERLARWRLSRMLVSKARRRSVRWRAQEVLRERAKTRFQGEENGRSVEDFLGTLDLRHGSLLLGTIARLQFSGFKTREIAEETGLSLRTVERRMRTIRDLARRHFGRDAS